MRIDIHCPNCSGPLAPTELSCPACEISIRGRFGLNEFAALGEDDLHFLRIFVRCEGRIREMESALGVSYPTIKGRMAKLRETLAAQAEQAGAAGGRGNVLAVPTAGSDAQRESAAAEVLRDLKMERIGYGEALEKLREIAKENA